MGCGHSRYIFNALAISQLGLTKTDRKGPKPVIKTTGIVDEFVELIFDKRKNNGNESKRREENYVYDK